MIIAADINLDIVELNSLSKVIWGEVDPRDEPWVNKLFILHLQQLIKIAVRLLFKLLLAQLQLLRQRNVLLEVQDVVFALVALTRPTQEE